MREPAVSTDPLSLEAARAMVVNGQALGARMVPQLRHLGNWAADQLSETRDPRGYASLVRINLACCLLIADARKDQLGLGL